MYRNETGRRAREQVLTRIFQQACGFRPGAGVAPDMAQRYRDLPRISLKRLPCEAND